MSYLKKYYKNRDRFKQDMLSFFESINFDDFSTHEYMFTFINNNRIYIISYDMDFTNKTNIISISKYRNNIGITIIFETNKFQDLKKKLYTYSTLKRKLRKNKLNQIL